MVQALIIDVLVLGGLFLIGFMLARLLLRSEAIFELAPIAFPLGGGIFTWILFMLSWLGVPISLLVVLGVYLSITIILVIVHVLLPIPTLARRISFGHSKEESSSLSVSIIIVPALLAILFLVAIFISVGRSYSTWDAVAIWSSKGYGIALEGSVFAAKEWGAHKLNYPLNVPLLISLFKLTSDDLLPGSKFIFPIFFFSLILGCLAFWFRRDVAPTFALLGALFITSVPVFYFHSTIGYANLPMACYVVLGTLAGIEGIFESSKEHQLLSGILLGLASWSRVETTLMSAIILLTLFCVQRITKRGKIYPVIWLIPVMMINGFWMIFFRTYGAKGSQVMSAVGSFLNSIQQGLFDFYSIRIIFAYFRRYVVHVPTWGMLFLVCAVLVLSNLRSLHPKKNPYAFAILLTILGTGSSTAFTFYVGSFISTGLYKWLQRGFPRAFFPTAIMVAVLAILVAGERANASLSSHPMTSAE